MRSDQDHDAGSVADAVGDRILSDHRGTVESVLAAADAVASRWGGDRVTDRNVVVDGLAGEIDSRALGDPLVDALTDGVAAAGYDLRADPVPAPPYLVVATRGPILRATVEDGRLVVTVEAFRVERGDGPPQYARAGPDPEESLSVEFRQGGES